MSEEAIFRAWGTSTEPSSSVCASRNEGWNLGVCSSRWPDCSGLVDDTLSSGSDLNNGTFVILHLYFAGCSFEFHQRPMYN